MKRIEFIAPVESMRGNLGGRQTIVYAPDNNRAFDSIEGELNPALNYEPRLIGARSKRNYFCVKTKSTCHLTTRAKNAMASLGGVGAIYSALVRDKMANVYINAKGCYDDAVKGGYTGTFRKYMYGFIKSALDAKEQSINISTVSHSVSIQNPWYDGLQSNVIVSKTILVKFWTELHANGGVFIVGGLTGIATIGDTIVEVVNSNYNILNLSVDNQHDFAKMGNDWLLDVEGNYLSSDKSIIGFSPYTLTNVAPA